MSLKRVCDLCGRELDNINTTHTYTISYKNSWMEWISGEKRSESYDICLIFQNELIKILKRKRDES